MAAQKDAAKSEAELASYFAKYPPAIAKLGKALRAKLGARLPGFSEVVYFYENQHSLVIAFSPTGRGYDAPYSIALYPEGVRLFFGRGAELSKADPTKILQGRGKTVRHVELKAVADLERAEIEALMVAAWKLASVRPDAGAKGALVLKAQSQRQRARRAKQAARPAAAKRSAKARR